MRSYPLMGLLWSLVLFCTFNSIAQPRHVVTTDPNPFSVSLPQLLPASPEVTSFVKAGVENVNMSTGAASAQIPLYTIKLGDYSFPISLSYSSQGLKADEASSRVGLGWVLNATAMISRSVNGKPDELVPHLKAPLEFSSNADSVYNFCANVSNPSSGYDTEADEFQFSCNGYAGKFVLDDDLVPRVTATSNVKITLEYGGSMHSTSCYISKILIVTPDGVQYSFGTAYERTDNYTLTFNNEFKNVTRTGFFLDKIELPTGEYINFNYASINTEVVTGVTQTLQFARPDGPDGCDGCMAQNSYTTTEDHVEYATQYLTDITTSDGLQINLSYEARNDQSGDNRLKSLVVGNIKHYEFNYFDIPIPSGKYVVTGRFFLTKVREVKLDADVISLDSSYDYAISYNGLNENTPLPISFSQDYLGYYNASPYTYLVPPTVNSSNTIDFSFRNPNHDAAKIGTLAAIQLPTGGREEFVYEPNSSGQYITRKKNTYLNVELAGNGGGSNWAVYTYDYVYVLKNHTATLTASAADAILDDGYTADPTHNTVIMRLYEGSTLIASRSVLGYESTSIDVNLLAGHNYKLELTVKNSTERGFASISYDTASIDYYETVYQESTLPGLRVKQIKYVEPYTLANHSKYYRYTTLADLQASTGGQYGIAAFESSGAFKKYCGQFGDLETNCALTIFSSSSSRSVYGQAGSGSLIHYTTVIESDDPNLKNGGTEYNFFPNENGGNHQALLGQEVPYLSMGQYPTLSGMVQSKKVFNANKEIVQEEINEYETFIYMDNAVNSHYVRMRYPPYITRPDRMDAFDVVKSTYASYWNRQKSQTLKTWSAGNLLTTKTDYTYGTPVNILPVTTVTHNSKGQEEKMEMKYPTDFVGDAVSDKLIAKNIISPAVEQSSYTNGTLSQQKKVVYKDWFNDNKILLPELIKLKQSPADILHDALAFEAYSTSGDVLQVKKVNDMPIAYLWDAEHGLALCEVKNALSSQVAFAGFEMESDYGNWQWVSGNTVTVKFTGAYGFTGTLSKTISTAGVYVVRLWTKSSATVNSAGGTLLRSARGWNLYEWKLTNPSSISVQGTNMDDIRLYPSTALMTTYTYRPFVGPTSMSDPVGNVVYYEYDGMSRLSATRDIDSSLLKNYAYQYAPDTDTKPSAWQPTGVTRCKPCALNAAYNSTYLQREEKDISPASSTHNNTRWVDVGNEGTCLQNAFWQNTATAPRCVKDAGNFNTGVQEQEQMDVNPCSNTYGQTKWIKLPGFNYTSCPLACPDCTTIDKKCINGVCVTGEQIMSNTYPVSSGQWECVYHYEFPDGSWSESYTITSSNPCGV